MLFNTFVGETVEPREEYYDHDPNNMDTHGIYFFLTKEAAYDYGRVIENGLYQDWYANGGIFACGMKKNGHNHGEWKIYHTNGKLCTISNWVDGKISGLSEDWDEDEVLHSIKIYRDGRTQKKIYYHRERYIMLYYNYNTADRITRVQEFRRDTTITLEDQMNHKQQLSKTENLVLSSDYRLVNEHKYN